MGFQGANTSIMEYLYYTKLISKKGKLTICDAHGKLVYQEKTNGDLLIDTASYASGVYFLQVNTDRFTIVK
jgi:hypothetical protein